MPNRRLGAIGQHPVGKKAIARGADLNNKDIVGSADSVLPNFTQSSSVSLTEYFVTADIASTLPSFTQEFTGTVGQKTVTFDGDSVLPSFYQFATSVEFPPKVAQIYTVLPSFTTSIVAVHTVDNIEGDIAQTLPNFQTKAYLELQEVIFADIDSQLPNFRQRITGNVTIKAVSGVCEAILPSMQQSVSGIIENASITASAASVLPSFYQNLAGSIDESAITGQILNNLPQFVQNSAGIVQNKAVSANITSQLPSFVQSIDAEYTISSANGLISSVLPRFQTNVNVNINDGQVISVIPSFITRVSGTRIPNSNRYGVVEPITVATQGTLLLETPIPDTYIVENALEIDRKNQITMNRATQAKTINTKVVIQADFKQRVQTNIIQRKVINYAND